VSSIPEAVESAGSRWASRTWVIVNENAGTVRTLGVAGAREAIARGLSEADLPARIEFVSGAAISAMVDEALSSGATDTIVVGGGDGTMSSVASKLAGTGKAMGVLPLGTMNLFAKALGMPDALEDAVKAIASARRVPIDVGRVNGRVFLHHISLGLHPRMARIRERIGYGSRLSKIINGVRAFLLSIRRPPKLRLDAVLDGMELRLTSPAVLVSNNLFGEGHVPYQDKLDDGILGMYVVNTFQKGDIFRLAGGLLTANWQASPHVDIRTARKLEIRSLKSGWAERRKILASVDGELEYIKAPLRIEILPTSLVVLSAKS
jgi:diacylglycerol kinase family enzyme